MKRILFSLQLAMVALLFASAPTAIVAQSDVDMDAGVVISIASMDEHLGDIEHLMEAAGVGQLAGMVRMGAAEYIRGIDSKKPLGALLFFDEENPEEPGVLGFVPVTDIEDVLDTLAPFVDIDEDGDDIVLTADDGPEITVRVVDGYAFIVQDKEMLENLPGNPVAMLKDLPKEYNFAARVFGQNIPESLRQQAIDLIRSGAAAEMDNLGDGPEADLQRANFEYTMSQIEGFINETEELVAGLAIDQENKRILLDFHMVGLEGSKMALQSNEFGNAPASRFSGFVADGATASLHTNMKLLKDDLEQVQKTIEELKNTAKSELEGEGLSGDEAEMANKVLDDLFTVLDESVARGVMDGGAMLNLEDGLQFAAGLGIAEGAKLEDSVKKLAQWAEAEGAPATFNFDIESKNGVRYHQVKIDVPENEEEARAILGSELEIILGVGDDVLYIAAGDDPKGALAKCIGASSKSEKNTVAQMNLHLLPLIKFLSKVQDAPELDEIAGILPDDADDQIRFTLSTIPNGQKFRFEMQDAILKVLTEVGQSMGGGFGPAQDF